MAAIHKDTDTSDIGRTSTNFVSAGSRAVTAENLNKAAWIGIAAGLRSMLPLVVLNTTSKQSSPTLKKLTTILAVSEVIADKLPVMPGRVTPISFVGRIAIGTLSGVVVSKRLQQRPLEGAMRGALGACLGTIAGYTIRSFASNATGIPDFIWALAEDGTAFTLAINATMPE